jgi:hypothetical protein
MFNYIQRDFLSVAGLGWVSVFSVCCATKAAGGPTSPGDAGAVEPRDGGARDSGGRCGNATQAKLLGTDGLTSGTGLTVCRAADGRATRVDRTQATVCPAGVTKVTCTADAACADQCNSEKDCSVGSACICAAWTPPVTGSSDLAQLVTLDMPRHCVPAQCATSSDCGGRACGFSRNLCGADAGFYCRTASDECTSSDDCGGRLCTYDTAKLHWACDPMLSCDSSGI